MTEQKTANRTYYQRLMLWSLSNQPMTAKRLAEAIGVSPSCAAANIRKLKASGLIREDGHEQRQGQKTTIWATHAAHQKPDPIEHQANVAGPDRTAYAAVKAALLAAPMTAQELVQLLGGTYAAVKSTLRYWRGGPRAGKHFRICGWQKNERIKVPVFEAKAGQDCPKPAPDRQGSRARWRERNRALIRAKSASYSAKRRGETVKADPFQQLFVVTGCAVSAARINKKQTKQANNTEREHEPA